MWFSAKVYSNPSSVSRRLLNMAPALLIKTSMRGSLWAISAATRFISDADIMIAPVRMRMHRNRASLRDIIG